MAIVMIVHLKARNNRVVRQCIPAPRKNSDLHQEKKNFDSILPGIYKFCPLLMR